jgi:hypothetical protein
MSTALQASRERESSIVLYRTVAVLALLYTSTPLNLYRQHVGTENRTAITAAAYVLPYSLQTAPRTPS